MKLRVHHIEMCVKNKRSIEEILTKKFGFSIVGKRETDLCEQSVLQFGQTFFLISKSKWKEKRDEEEEEPWTYFCSQSHSSEEEFHVHVDSVFNVALQVEDLKATLKRFEPSEVIRGIRRVNDNDSSGFVDYAIIKSSCGNLIHTLIEKNKSDFSGWFLPSFVNLVNCKNGIILEEKEKEKGYKTKFFFDHVALACRTGETNQIIHWYKENLGMQRYLTNRADSLEDGLVIGEDVGMRLKVMEFWACSENGIGSSWTDSTDQSEEQMKFVVVESLPNIKNTQIENFVREHKGPGVQHIGIHSENIIETVEEMSKRGVSFRQPPDTYYTDIGQLNPIIKVGENPEVLSKYGILLDDEADIFDCNKDKDRYLMQIFTFPLFDADTFFMEVIQRKGATGFGVGNVTALARSVDIYNKMKSQNFND